MEQTQFQPQQQTTELPTMSFGDALASCYEKYATFSGRATRAEFWWFNLFTTVVSMVLNVILPILSLIFSLAVLLPSLAVSWRRLHDIGKAGGWWFLGLIPIIGQIILLVWYCTKSQPIDNRFGEYPGRKSNQNNII